MVFPAEIGQLLSWRDATVQDRAGLQTFQCTTPKPSGRRYREPHPKPWEHEVQQGIRALEPPKGGGSTVFLGVDDHGIAAVTVWTALADPGEYYLQAVAVANRHRGQGGAHAREALKMAVSVMETQAIDRGADTLYIASRVHEENRPSQRGLAETGFREDDSIFGDLARHHGWVLYRDLRGGIT